MNIQGAHQREAMEQLEQEVGDQGWSPRPLLEGNRLQQRPDITGINHHASRLLSISDKVPP